MIANDADSNNHNEKIIAPRIRRVRDAVTIIFILTTISILGVQFLFPTDTTLSQTGSAATAKLSLRHSNQEIDDVVPKKVIIVGAGAAGLTAAYQLRKHGIDDYIILEASDHIGGRVQKDDTFADYPIDLGATHLFHINMPSQILGQYVPLKGILSCINGHEYDKGREPIEAYRYCDAMFVNTSNYDFLNDYIAPKPSEREETIVFGCKVEQVSIINANEHSTKTARAVCGDIIYAADYMIITVPISILREEEIRFDIDANFSMKSLIDEHTDAVMWKGFKIFFEFSKRFYDPHFYWREDHNHNTSDGYKNGESEFWDYSIANNSSRNIVSGFITGGPNGPLYINKTDSEILEIILKRLDYVYNDEATKSLVKYRVANWAQNPLFRGTYSDRCPKNPGVPHITSTIFLAGEAFTLDENTCGYVAGAAFSGKHAANEIILLEQEKAKEQSVKKLELVTYTCGGLEGKFVYDDLVTNKSVDLSFCSSLGHGFRHRYY